MQMWQICQGTILATLTMADTLPPGHASVTNMSCQGTIQVTLSTTDIMSPG